MVKKYNLPGNYLFQKDIPGFYPPIEDQYFFAAKITTVEEPLIMEEQFNLSEAKVLFDYLHFNQADVAEVLEIDPSTLVRWKKEDKLLSRLLTKTIKDMDKIIAKGIRIFGSEVNFLHWLNTSNEALGNQKPIDMMRNPNGLEWIDQALDALSWGNVF
ncbi:antitoxin Xre/MbcA/ParS toxin-binding domain-containing protein [Shivajiella indica]|uniref:Antitoxin Xre/MbcA/ParS toxin-binding domain-containing protein n=1 Tax=Shivajiella indica TaxID=872115 RepID=A0ABW5B6L3_9BACT